MAEPLQVGQNRNIPTGIHFRPYDEKPRKIKMPKNARIDEQKIDRRKCTLCGKVGKQIGPESEEAKLSMRRRAPINYMSGKTFDWYICCSGRAWPVEKKRES